MRELKAKPGRELQVYGSGELLRWLLERDLVDELNLLLYPVVGRDDRSRSAYEPPVGRPSRTANISRSSQISPAW